MKLHGAAKKAFLRRMAKGRKRRPRAKRAKRRNRKGHHVMAKKRKRATRRGRRGGSRRSHRRGSAHAGGRGLNAIKADSTHLIVGAVYGAIEGKAAKDDTFILNKVPRPVTALGYTGNIALALYAATYFTSSKWVRVGARVVATIASYKLGKNGGAFQTSDKTSIGGDGDDDIGGDERVIDEHVMGALDAEARGGTNLNYDDVVREAGSRA